MIFLSILYFLSWTFILYWIHRCVHNLRYLRTFHLDHHKFINQSKNNKSKWEFNNLLLFNDNIKSTVDLWITEVIPTLIFSYITGAWWIFMFYYIWAALFQEVLEHKKNLNLPYFTAGEWHLLHHKNLKSNFGLFLPIWDYVFGTNKKV